MRSLFAALVLFAALPLAAAPAAAQGLRPFTVGGRIGIAVPLDDFASNAETGYITEVVAKVSPLPFVTVYGGWSLAEFGVDSESAVAGLETKLRESGFRTGAELAVPLAGLLSGFAPYLQTGVLFNRAEVRVAGDGTNTLGMKSDRSTGFELGVGARVKLARSVSVAPEVRYRGYEPEFATAPQVRLGERISYLATTVALTYHF